MSDASQNGLGRLPTGRHAPGAIRLARRAIRALRAGGPQQLADDARRWALRRWGQAGEELGLLPEHVRSAGGLQYPRVPPKSRGPLKIAWILTPPGPGSGGHTTIFRMVQALEAAGHHCRLCIYDWRGSAAGDFEGTIRQWWPDLRAPVVDVAGGVAGADVIVATSWQTAHVLAGTDERAHRMYFVQDYEPWFYPRGAASELASMTYDFGFHPITIGTALAEELRRRHGITAMSIPFGCDHAVYSVQDRDERNGVMFYSRPGAARRGYELGILALEEFHRMRPGVEIHIVGALASAVSFPAQIYRTLTPRELCDLYNRCGAGLALSFTNISLVPFELLAAGSVPVMNDWIPARADLTNDFVVRAAPHPLSLAHAVAGALDLQRTAGADAVAASVDTTTWALSGRVFVGHVERLAYSDLEYGAGNTLEGSHDAH